MIAVTGATGHLGRLVVADLIKRGAKPNTIVALVRDKAKASDLVSQGVDVRVADYAKPESLAAAFKGVDRVLLISGTDFANRIQHHANVINAAKNAHVKLIAYTSILKADKSTISLAADHLATEKAILASGLPYAILRNSWYLENYSEHVQDNLKHGVIEGNAKDGRVSAASRADYASAAAVVLLKDKVESKVYELAGKSFSLPELATLISKVSHKEVKYAYLSAPERAQKLAGFGLPPPVVQMLVSADSGIDHGDLFTESRDLENLIGRAPTEMEAALRKALA